MAQVNMMPIIRDKDFNRIAEIDDYISFIWTKRYYTPGNFELCAPISKLQFLEVGNYVFRKGDEYGAIIEKIEIKKTDEAQEMVIASGRLLESIIGRRVISTQQQITGKVTDGISDLIYDNVTEPQVAARQISNFTFSNDSVCTDEIDSQYLGQNLLEVVSSLCETFHIGMKCKLNGDNIFNFYLYDGVDRSYDQSANTYVVFSDDFDNLLNCDYIESIEEMATDVLVGGEGEGTSRTMVWSTEEEMSGLERFEKFLDASSAVSNDHIITQETYEKQLEGLGLAELTEYTTAFSGEVNFNSVNFGIDVQVGDIVSIENKRWNIYINTRILEVIESVGEDGKYEIIPTFGV